MGRGVRLTLSHIYFYICIYVDGYIYICTCPKPTTVTTWNLRASDGKALVHPWAPVQIPQSSSEDVVRLENLGFRVWVKGLGFRACSSKRRASTQGVAGRRVVNCSCIAHPWPPRFYPIRV